MNSKREDYYPVVGYIIMFVAISFLLWLLDIATTFMGCNLGISSPVSSEGLRWAMRNALPALGRIPWAGVLLVVSSFGLLQGAGVVRLFCRITKLQRLTKMEIRSLLFSVGSILVYTIVVYLVTFSKWNILLGITGTFENSSFLSGLPLILFLGIVIMTVVYGFMYGNYRSFIDVLESAGNAIKLFTPAILALIPAAAIIAMLEYAGVFKLLGLAENEAEIIAMVLYAIPFMHMIFRKRGKLSVENA